MCFLLYTVVSCTDGEFVCGKSLNLNLSKYKVHDLYSAKVLDESGHVDRDILGKVGS